MQVISVNRWKKKKKKKKKKKSLQKVFKRILDNLGQSEIHFLLINYDLKIKSLNKDIIKTQTWHD